MTREPLVTDAEEGLGQLVDDAGAAKLRERVVGWSSGDDGAVGQLIPGPMVVGDDHIESGSLRFRDFLNSRNPAVHGEHETEALSGEPRERLARHAVAFLEPARQMPRDVGTQLAKHEDSERSGADPVDVVVAVDADSRSRCGGRMDALAGRCHVTEHEGVVPGRLAREKSRRGRGIVVPPADQHTRDRLAHIELAREPRSSSRIAGLDPPRRLAHGQATVRRAPDGNARSARFTGPPQAPPWGLYRLARSAGVPGSPRVPPSLFLRTPVTFVCCARHVARGDEKDAT
jgi:hypothetical protein